MLSSLDLPEQVMDLLVLCLLVEMHLPHTVPQLAAKHSTKYLN